MTKKLKGEAERFVPHASRSWHTEDPGDMNKRDVIKNTVTV